MKNFIKQNWLLIISLLYIISPIDFIPEFIAGPLGLTDDFGLVIILLLKATYSYWKSSKNPKKNGMIIDGDKI